MAMETIAAGQPKPSPRLEVCGVTVDFPFMPYDCQMSYMEGVIQALMGAHNALLESPTGTGKTLCLLCSSLAWQQGAKQQMSAADSEGGAAPLRSGSSGDATFGSANGMWQQVPASMAVPAPMPSTIIYASRTHSQLSQVVRELKRTTYRPRLSLLGSREQLCVHETVSKMKGTAMNNACGTLVKGRRCKFHVNLNEGGISQPEGVLDIEELVQEGKKQSFCPYYFGRGEAAQADLVLMPYNYLLDPTLRKAVKVNWSNAVVIFDEAHNLEGVASDSASFELTSIEISGAIAELQRCILRSGETYTLEYGGSSNSGASEKDGYLALKDMLLRLETCLMQINLPAGNGITRRGDFIYAMLAEAGVTFETIGEVLGYLERAVEALLDALPIEGAQAQSSLQLEAVLKALRVCFRGGNATREQCVQQSQLYRVHVMRAANRRNGRPAPFSGGGGGRGEAQNSGRVLCYWCFCPGIAMQDLKSLGVRSIILTSGTLSPLASFAHELRLPFKIQLENPHVVSSSQAWVGTCGTGVTGAGLLSTYEHRDTPAYKTELGNTIASICRVVPGGMLVFFPTYNVMQRCVEHWQATGVWARICALKEALHEPRSASELKEVMEIYDEAILRRGGAVLFAVCRGKVSEGVDFSDERARCVVVTGIPFAPTQDAKVDLKRKYMDEVKLPPGMARLTGSDWYVQQASRAVNQAVGRIIRHRDDFGAVVLCDSRFKQERQRANLSKWVRPFLRDLNGFSGVVHGLANFFRNARDDPRLTPKVTQPRQVTVAEERNAVQPAAKTAVVSLDSNGGADDSVCGGYVNPGSLEDMQDVLAAARSQSADQMRRWRAGNPAAAAGSSCGGSSGFGQRSKQQEQQQKQQQPAGRGLADILGSLGSCSDSSTGELARNGDRVKGQRPRTVSAANGSLHSALLGFASSSVVASAGMSSGRSRWALAGSGLDSAGSGGGHSCSSSGGGGSGNGSGLGGGLAEGSAGAGAASGGFFAGHSQGKGKGKAPPLSESAASIAFGARSSGLQRPSSCEFGLAIGGSGVQSSGGTFKPLPDAALRAAAAASAALRNKDKGSSSNRGASSTTETRLAQPARQPTAVTDSGIGGSYDRCNIGGNSAMGDGAGCSSRSGDRDAAEASARSASSGCGNSSQAPAGGSDKSKSGENPQDFLRDLKSALSPRELSAFRGELKASKAPDVIGNPARFLGVMDNIVSLLLATPPALALADRLELMIPHGYRKRYLTLLKQRRGMKEMERKNSARPAVTSTGGRAGAGSKRPAPSEGSMSAPVGTVGGGGRSTGSQNGAASTGKSPAVGMKTKGGTTEAAAGGADSAAGAAAASATRSQGISKRAKLMAAGARGDAAAASTVRCSGSGGRGDIARKALHAGRARSPSAAAVDKRQAEEAVASGGSDDELDIAEPSSQMPFPMSQRSAGVMDGLARANRGVASAATSDLPAGLTDRSERVVCCVCHEAAESPHAAACHHVCCLRCWQKLLEPRPASGISSSGGGAATAAGDDAAGGTPCPLCRAPVCKSQLTRLVFRAAVQNQREIRASA